MAAWLRVSTLNSVDLPTFGRPTIATIGNMRLALLGRLRRSHTRRRRRCSGGGYGFRGTKRAEHAIVGKHQHQSASHDWRAGDALFVGNALGADDRVAADR